MEIKFNTFDLRKLAAGKTCAVDTIDNICPEGEIKKEDLPGIQIFNSGYRINSKNIDWNCWNGCVFIDVDGKQYYNNVKQFNSEILKEYVINQVIYCENLYWFQESATTGKGNFHFCFYFDVEKTEFNYNCCLNYAEDVVHNIYKSAGKDAEEIINYEGVLDTHNEKPYQGLYISTNEIFYGLDCTGDICNVDFTERDIVDKFFNDSPVEIEANEYEIGENTSKIKIDRHTKIGSYFGNDARWRISSIANKIFGDSAEKWCNEHFYYENGKSIYQKADYGINNSVLNWLINNNYILKKKTFVSNIKLEEGEWISDKFEEITNYIDAHDRVELIAGTGIGKTTLINGVRERFFDNSESLANFYNAVVIVPYNATNKLYNNLVEISSSNNNEIDDDVPCVMVFDQAVKHWAEIKNRNIIIDEVHTLFTERNFRTSAIKLVEMIQKEHDGKLICVTATPTGELELFNLKPFFVENLKNEVKVACCYSKYVDTEMLNLVKYTIHYGSYDRIIIMDDNNAEKLFQNLVYVEGISEDEIAYLRSSTKDTEDYRKIIEDEFLHKKIIICTRVAYNGLNFKNENERILIITSYTPYKNIASEYIQIIGRIRRSDVNCVILYDKEFDSDREMFEDINKRDIEAKKIIEQSTINANIYNFNDNCTDETWVNAQLQIENYILNHAKSLNDVINELKEFDYIKIMRSEIKDVLKNRLQYKLKIMESDEIKQYMKDNEDWTETMTEQKFEGKKYAYKWVKDLRNVLGKYDCEKVCEWIQKKNARIDKTISDVKFILSIAALTDDEFIQYINKLDEVVERFIMFGWKAQIKGLLDKRERVYKIRNAWQATLKTENRIDALFEQEINDLEEFLFGVSEKRSEAGKIGKKVIVTEKIKESRIDLLKKYNLSIGQEFESCGDIAKYINKSNKTVSEWINKGWIS